MTADVQREPLVDLLVAHQRQGNGGGCLCGGVRLGESYPEHVADLLLPLIADAEKRAAAGALEPFAALAAEYAERSAKVPDGFWKRHLWIVSQRLRAALDPPGAAEGAGR